MKTGNGRLDLAGQRYGKLTVLEPAENLGKQTAWRCRCDCGKEAIVRTSSLRCGHTASCGCLKQTIVHGAGASGLTYVAGTCVEMIQAKTVRRNNTSGVPGVDWVRDKRRWRASICFQGRRHYLGKFERFEDAVKARREAEEALHDSFLREYARKSEDSSNGCLPSPSGTADINYPAENR